MHWFTAQILRVFNGKILFSQNVFYRVIHVDNFKKTNNILCKRFILKKKKKDVNEKRKNFILSEHVCQTTELPYKKKTHFMEFRIFFLNSKNVHEYISSYTKTK